jgi:hypothetical protein
VERGVAEGRGREEEVAEGRGREEGVVIREGLEERAVREGENHVGATELESEETGGTGVRVIGDK